MSVRVNPQIFREYDVRGLHERDLTDEAVRAIGKAFGTFLRRRGKRTLAVGRDFRTSSSRIERALTDGLTATGCAVLVSRFGGEPDAGAAPFCSSAGG